MTIAPPQFLLILGQRTMGEATVKVDEGRNFMVKLGLAFTGGVFLITVASEAAIALDPPSASLAPEQEVFHFTIDVSEGSLAGMSFDGSFCYDPTAIDSTGTETVGVEDGLRTRIVFFNQPFTEVNDSDYPDFPQLTLVDGEVENLDFWIEAGDRLPWWDLPGWNVTLIPTDDGTECPASANSESSRGEAFSGEDSNHETGDSESHMADPDPGMPPE